LSELPPEPGAFALRVAVDGPDLAGPGDLARTIAERLPALGRAAVVVPADGFYRPASVRLEHGRTDAYARYTGTAPLPVWSSNRARYRLSRTGNRQLNAALHRMALTQMRVHPPAKAMIERRRAGGDGGMEALRVLKRRLSDVAYHALRADLNTRAELTAA